jgi:acyl-CoA thioesterase
VGDFDRDTRLALLGGRRYRATPHPDWEIWGPKGGYVAAIALRAAGAEAAIPRPSSFTCHYLAVARFEPVEIDVEVLRAGRRSELIRATMRQEGRLIVETLLLDTIAWPAACGPHAGRDMIAPSLDVTVWFHELDPSSEWLRCHETAPRANAGLMGAMGWIYSEAGRLLASGGSHLLCAPSPPEG